MFLSLHDSHSGAVSNRQARMVRWLDASAWRNRWTSTTLTASTVTWDRNRRSMPVCMPVRRGSSPTAAR